MDRTTTYVVIALIILVGIGAWIYSSTGYIREPTNAPSSVTGTGSGTSGTARPATAPPEPATPPPPPATKP
ncbi:MAG: hypothetical protein R3D44_16150 [Hyphomicrobiaceae bacterium]